MKTELPTDPFDQLLARLIGLPNGAHAKPTIVQTIDFYGNATQYTVQTVRTDEGDTTFITQGNAATYLRFILPPQVLTVIDRQRDANTHRVRRRHGQRLADERKQRGERPAFMKAVKK